jgi:hypothetical protein
VVNSSEKLKEALSQPWDLLIHHCYLGDWKEPVDTTTPYIIEAFQKGRLRGVICASALEVDARKFCKPLLEAGVPFKFIPFSYQAPSEHKVVPLKLEALQLPASMD